MRSPGGEGAVPELAWWRSSYTASNGNCVEVARVPAAVAVRDSKRPGDAVAFVSRSAWVGFVAAVAEGRL
ncbi:DUF397 domain-containing protein [Streptomyces lonarensis]|uniref:DUF397 domain-containing protein n=1 Tax=Streptomyces lonarensis TaxID=700599 RepID=A0A7X6D4U2_9ACTN|nr:DUF397 domain-containing protein [Streptomyces lonarensis]NJQ08211.1 DUF397 domain-containing protein [Streptomyces lonarensis]